MEQSAGLLSGTIRENIAYGKVRKGLSGNLFIESLRVRDVFLLSPSCYVGAYGLLAFSSHGISRSVCCIPCIQIILLMPVYLAVYTVMCA